MINEKALRSLRRRTRSAMLVAATALALSAPTVGLAEAAEKLVISNWDAYMPKDLLERFKAATGYDAEVTVHATNEEIMGKVVASGGRGYDVLFVSGQFAQALNQLGLVEPLDHSKLPNLKNLYPEASQLKHDPGNAFSIPYSWGTTGLCFRSDVVKTEPTSWNDLLKPSPDLAKKVTMLATDRWLLGAGLKVQGLSVNETDPAKLEATKAILIDAKKNLLAYDDTTFYSKLVSGEASLVHAWDGWCNYGTAENAAIKYVVPKEGTDLWVDTIVITKASENKEAAHAFLNFILQPDVAKWVSENIMYKTPNKAGMESLDKALFEKYPNLAMTPADLLKQEQLLDVGKAQKEYSRIVTEVMNAK
jgi:spermidine/putrescine transport system substrate-binding protein